MTTARTRTPRQGTETVVVKVPPRVYAAVKRLADAEYTTPRGYIERRLSEVAMREADARQQMHVPEPSDPYSERSESEPVDGYLQARRVTEKRAVVVVFDALDALTGGAFLVYNRPLEIPMSTGDTMAVWTDPPGDTEQDKQSRTERMIREAIRDHAAFDNCQLSVYAKGSYANNTNVRADSDVDIAVQCHDVQHWAEASPGAHPRGTRYAGIWMPSKLRTEVGAALRAKFPGERSSN